MKSNKQTTPDPATRQRCTHILVLERVDERSRGVVVLHSIKHPGLRQQLLRRAIAHDASIALALAVLPGGVLQRARGGADDETSAPKLFAERLSWAT